MLVSDSQQFCEPGQWVFRQPLLSPVQQHHRVLLHLATAPVVLAALLRVELQWFLRRYSAEPEPPDPRLAGAAVRRAARAEPERRTRTRTSRPRSYWNQKSLMNWTST